jgi:hypothetical protein
MSRTTSLVGTNSAKVAISGQLKASRSAVRAACDATPSQRRSEKNARLGRERAGKRRWVVQWVRRRWCWSGPGEGPCPRRCPAGRGRGPGGLSFRGGKAGQPPASAKVRPAARRRAKPSKAPTTEDRSACSPQRGALQTTSPAAPSRSMGKGDQTSCMKGCLFQLQGTGKA